MVEGLYATVLTVKLRGWLTVVGPGSPLAGETNSIPDAVTVRERERRGKLK